MVALAVFAQTFVSFCSYPLVPLMPLMKHFNNAPDPPVWKELTTLLTWEGNVSQACVILSVRGRYILRLYPLGLYSSRHRTPQDHTPLRPYPPLLGAYPPGTTKASYWKDLLTLVGAGCDITTVCCPVCCAIWGCASR